MMSSHISSSRSSDDGETDAGPTSAEITTVAPARWHSLVVFPSQKVSIVGIERLLHHSISAVPLTLFKSHGISCRLEWWLIVISFQKFEDLFMLKVPIFGVI